ncbi:hypothetical protein NUACC21_48060 [Scytonema sp. NUACC21]
MTFEEAIKVVEAAFQEHEDRHLNDVELAILRGSWENMTYDDMAKNFQYQANYLKGDAGHKFWKKLSEVLGESVSKRNFRAVLERSQSRFFQDGATPMQPIDLDCNYYIERPPIDSLCRKEIMTPGALLRIKASPKMGKTLLLSKLINHTAKVPGYRGVDLKLRLAEKEDFENLDTFLQWFCSSVTQMLELESDNKVKQHWDKHLGNSKLKCMDYFEDCLLNDKQGSLVLGLDDVDRIYQFSEIAEEFLGLLRSWHEKAKTRPVWQKLRLILVYTEEYAPLDINRSPFTVGTVVELPEFSPAQVEDLAKRYELNWNTTEVQQLMEMVNGHPYLVREALEHVTSWDIKLEDLLATIKHPTRAGIYSDLLQEHLWNLRKYVKHKETLNHSKLEEALKEETLNHSKLEEALKKVVMNNSPVELDSVLATKLYELGLVKLQGNAVIPFCELYRLYFKELLKDTQ